MNPSFEVYHPCSIELKNGEYTHHLGKVDNEQVICPKCFESFTHWIDLWKYHNCKTKTQVSQS